jgi:Xaa-Pro aminopeptidase
VTDHERDEGIRVERLLAAQGRAAELFEAIEDVGILQPGVSDWAATDAVYELAAQRFGVEEHWHKRIIRSGPHTLQPYNLDPPDRVMTEDDIVFGDFGPIFDGWEADFGRTWVLGDDPVKLRLRDDLAVVFDAAKAWFGEQDDPTGGELFAEVTRLTVERGWTFGNVHCGHNVGEFPHENITTDNMQRLLTAENTTPIRTVDPSGRVAHWILEIHLVDRDRQIGGFYEELLTIG